jgi:hypothetical protein
VLLLAAGRTGKKEAIMIQPRRKRALMGFGLALFLVTVAAGQDGKSVDQSNRAIERSSKVYIAPIEGGFDTFLAAAIIKKVYLKGDEVVYGYSVKKGNSYRGKQSAAEACAKHLKEKIEGK